MIHCAQEGHCSAYHHSYASLRMVEQAEEHLASLISESEYRVPLSVIQSANQTLASANNCWHESTCVMIHSAQEGLRSAYHHSYASLRMVEKARKRLASLDTDESKASLSALDPLPLLRRTNQPFCWKRLEGREIKLRENQEELMQLQECSSDGFG